MQQETIFALASAPGRAGIAVVRVSGTLAKKSLSQLSSGQFPPRRAVLTKLVHPVTKSLIDEAIVVYFQPPQSYTGEDVIEYHIHGGRAVRESLLNALAGIEGHRLAEPGEFTRRAFENGRMDLTQAEAVADLIHAETEAQKQLALSQMGGVLSALYQGWAGQLAKALAYAEAQIDFADEDLPEDELRAHIMPTLHNVSRETIKHLDDGHRGEILRDGVKIAIIGAPNAGKSSLINALAHRDVAIVSDMAGTTRDILEVHLDLNGYPVTFYDTAGLRPEQLNESEAQDKVEAEGIRRAIQKAKEADFKILLFDGAAPQLHRQTLDLLDGRSFVVINKIDLGIPSDIVLQGLQAGISSPVRISTKTGAGLSDLTANVSRETAALLDTVQSTPSLTRARHRQALEQMINHLARAMQGSSPDMIAEDIRLAVRAVGRITGRVDVEDLLDIIFRDFCIGK